MSLIINPNDFMLPKTAIVLLLFISSLLISCAQIKCDDTSDQPMTLNPSSNYKNTGWRTICFHLAWQRQQEPDWSIGTQIAGEILAPLLVEPYTKVTAWRFHRRAADDAIGHTFSLMIYSSAELAAQIYEQIKNKPMTLSLQKTGEITQIDFDPIDKNLKPEIKDTSDSDWPLAIQKSWPKFIMGASQMWLELVLEIKSKQPDHVNQRLAYQAIHQEVTTLWEKHGQHAWLHHLNALYGYSPLNIHF